MRSKSNQDRVEAPSELYRSVVGSFAYAIIATRPELTTVSSPSQFVETPGRNRSLAVKRVLRYLAGTVNSMQPLDGIPMVDSSVDLV